MTDGDETRSGAEGPRRRRQNHPGGRTRKIEVKVTAVEEEQLRAAAEHAGMSVQRLMVARVLEAESVSPGGYAAKVAAWKKANEMRNLISGIAVNMNQIARYANTNGEIPADFAAAVAATLRTCDRVRDAFGEVFSVRCPGTKVEDLPEAVRATHQRDCSPSEQDDPDEWNV
ncbi:plasmid mobilization protein [Gordonia sp. 1D]|uniref:plasmid mobilization protein n=1 Tax=Gordonia sp. 1D TaxID=1737359 RepID=UPI000BB7A03C|nr:plasmid mobilization relaxosome protein MobC [Gordonia sp. 1D]